MPSAASSRRRSPKIVAVLGDELEDARADRVELLLGASGRRRRSPATRSSSWRRSPDTRTWKNSSRLLAKKNEELHPLEERVADVARLVEHACVELEPRQLAVEDREPLVPRGPSATAAGSARTGCGSNGGHGPRSDRTGPGRGRDDTCDPIPVGPPRIPRRRTEPRRATPPVRGGFRCDPAPPA